MRLSALSCSRGAVRAVKTSTRCSSAAAVVDRSKKMEGPGLCRSGLAKPRAPPFNEERTVRTTIEIDDKLMRDAIRATGATSKRQVVELGLKTLVQLRVQEKVRKLKGKITWEGDLNAMRTGG